MLLRLDASPLFIWRLGCHTRLGGIGKASGRIKHSPCSSYEDAITFIRNISKIRIRRGYQLQEPFHQTQ